MKPSSTLIITTYNRSALIAQAIKSAMEALRKAPEAEVIIVDNNSTDDTESVVNNMIRSSGFAEQIKYVKETVQGVSRARNRGLSESNGKYIAYMDDDQIIHPDYLFLLPSVFNETSADCVGGKIIWKGEVDFPNWIRPLVYGVGNLNLGDAILEIDAKGFFLKGGNMAFTRSALEFVGGFNERLGRKGGELLAAEEDEMQMRFVSLGKKVFYHPKLIQYNILLPEKLNRKYWRRQAFDYGRTQYLLNQENWVNARLVAGVPGSIYIEFIKSLYTYARELFLFDRTRVFSSERKLWEMLGVAAASRKSVRGKR